MKDRPKSKELFDISLTCIPGGVNSPVRSFKSFGITPIVLEKGTGDTIYDVDGNSYIDFCCSWGSLILGHSPINVMKKVEEQLYLGTSFGTLTALETQYAKDLIDTLGMIEQIRFVTSGTEATMTALRLARGYTGKNKVVKFTGNYHGHADFLLIKAGSGVSDLKESSSLGIPKEILNNVYSLTYNDVDEFVTFMEANDDIAAVILEPVAGNMGVVAASPEFLCALREMTLQKKALLIIDEVITGFRLGLKGACDYLHIQPDLVCYGKIIGGGFPVAAFGGKKQIMQMLSPVGGVYQAGTLSGSPVAMKAGYETLQVIKQEGFYDKLEAKTEFFLKPIRDFIDSHNLPITLATEKSMFSFFFDVEKVKDHKDLSKINILKFNEFFLNLFDKGIYLSPSPHEACFISSAHTLEHLQKAQELIIEELARLYKVSEVALT